VNRRVRVEVTGTAAVMVGMARGLQKGIDVFVHRLARNRSKE
jgi:hypothetical protein